MKRLAFTMLLALVAVSLHAAQVSVQVDGETSVVGGASTNLGNGSSGNVSEQADRLVCVISPQLENGSLLRIGTEWDRYSFALPASAPLPNTLQSFDLVLGCDLQLFDAWLLRIEAHPGFYSGSGDVTQGSFNVPFIIGGSYVVSPDLQWVVGASIDVNRQYPFLPAAGVRWKFSEKSVLNCILPRPRYEYEWNKSLTLYAGGDIKGGTFRVDTNFGDAHNNPRLNSAVVIYWEVRAGAGATWKFSSGWTAEFETGYMPYRDFNFQRAGNDYPTNQGAPYGQFVVGGKF